MEFAKAGTCDQAIRAGGADTLYDVFLEGVKVGKKSVASFRPVCIFTALPVEFQAVKDHLTNTKKVVHEQGTVYEQGDFISANQSWKVTVAEIGAGNPMAALEVDRAIQHFKPEVILFVGVAGGIKDVVLGDVVAAEKVYGYESGKAGEFFHPRPEVGNSTYGIVQRARAEVRDKNWLQRIKASPDVSPRAFVKPIAAGEKVVVSTRSDVCKFIQSQYSDALAVEMEGRGFLLAAHANLGVEALIIRGISDLINDKAEADASGSQEIAARNASAFAFEVLANFDISESWQRFGIVDISAEWKNFSAPTKIGMKFHDCLKQLGWDATWYIVTINPEGFAGDFLNDVILPALENGVKLKWAYVRLPEEGDDAGKILCDWWASQYVGLPDDIEQSLRCNYPQKLDHMLSETLVQ